MAWAIITTVYGAILLFISSPQRLDGYQEIYLSKNQLAAGCKAFGLLSLGFSSVLWYSIEGWPNGLMYWSATVAVTWAVLMMSRPKMAHLVGTCTLLTTGSFLFSTVKMMMI